jgi:hypothetical protein
MDWTDEGSRNDIAVDRHSRLGCHEQSSDGVRAEPAARIVIARRNTDPSAALATAGQFVNH